MEIGALESFFDYAVRFIKVLRISDAADVFIVAIAVYYCIMALRGTRAMQLLRGIFIAAVVYMLSNISGCNGRGHSYIPAGAEKSS